jgi:hypothetical protein
MDLGKMLVEAFEEAGRVYIDGEYETRYTLFDEDANVTEVAEAFLLKVRMAEDEENRRRHPRGAVTISPAMGGEAWMVNGVLSYPNPSTAFDAWMASTEPHLDKE